MCYKIDAQPPIPAVAGAAVDSEDLVLTASDGNKFAAFVARPEKPSNVGMVVLPDVRGLFSFYEELALRFAEVGVNSVAFDYFGRTAGVSKRAAEFDFMPEVRKTNMEGITADTAAAVAYLKSPAGGSCTSIFAVGFCFGGSNAWLQAAAGHGLNGVVGFYGFPGPSPLIGGDGPIQKAPEMKGAVMALFGGADQMIQAPAIADLEKALNDAGVPNEVKTYEGAPHSFFDRAYEQFAVESADAWQRILAFIDKYK